jgi:hypothetical protein
VNVNLQFSEFGGKMKTLGILAILGFLFSIIANFIQFFSFINIIVQILVLVFILSALGNAKEIGYALNNRYILEFRSKIILAIILFLVGLLLFTVGIVLIYVGAIGAAIALIIVGILILIISAILRIQGWSRLQTFFEENQAMFPANIGADALSGAKFMKIAAILYLTIILMFIGFILEVIGYFKLAALKDLIGAPAAQPAAAPAAAPVTAPATANKFCPNCGTPVKGDEKYCSSCGSEI